MVAPVLNIISKVKGCIAVAIETKISRLHSPVLMSGENKKAKNWEEGGGRTVKHFRKTLKNKKGTFQLRIKNEK